MKKSLVSLGAAALATLLLVGSNVSAQGIPWAYVATSPPDIVATTSPQSTISFAGSSGNPNGNSGIIIYTVTANSFVNTLTSPADSFVNVPFNLAVKLSDINSTFSTAATIKTTDTVNFAGLFNATNVTPKSLLPGSVAGGNPNSWTVVAGNHVDPLKDPKTSAYVILGADDTGWSKYTVDLTSFTSPGQPNGAPGSIQAVVTITPTNGPGGSGEPNPSATPEPTSLVLAGLGLPLVVLLRRRMRKARTEAAIA